MNSVHRVGPGVCDMLLLLAGDLPVFLTQQLEALTVHNRYCDGCMVQPALPIQAATLLHQQKSLLEHQMRLS